MASLKKKDTDKQLRGKMSGDCDESAGDHYFYFFKLEGREVLSTKMSRPKKGDLDDHLIGLMAKQLKLSASDFRQYIQCTLSSDDWQQHLVTVAGKPERRR